MTGVLYDALNLPCAKLLADAFFFYIDKTNFIKEWWENGDAVTLITRPRRFGKTLAMSMMDYFFSIRHPGRSDLFEGLIMTFFP